MRKLFFIILSVIATITINHLDAHADILYFKDGTKKHVGRTWKEDGHVKWKTWGITVWYTEEELERVEKSPYEDYGIGTRPNANEKIKKEIKSPVQTFSQSELQSKGFRMADGIVLKAHSRNPLGMRALMVRRLRGKSIRSWKI